QDEGLSSELHCAATILGRWDCNSSARPALGEDSKIHGAAQTDYKSFGFLFRCCVLGHHHHHGARPEAARASHVCGTSTALANCVELRGELLLHCHRLAQSPPPAAVLSPLYPAPDLDKLCAPLHGIARAVLDSVGG